MTPLLFAFFAAAGNLLGAAVVVRHARQPDLVPDVDAQDVIDHLEDARVGQVQRDVGPERVHPPVGAPSASFFHLTVRRRPLNI